MLKYIFPDIFEKYLQNHIPAILEKKRNKLKIFYITIKFHLMILTQIKNH